MGEAKPSSGKPNYAGFFAGAVVVCLIVAYAIYATRSAGADAALEAAMLVLRQAQTEYRRVDRNGNGYLEYPILLSALVETEGAPLISREMAAACDTGAATTYFGYTFRMMPGFIDDSGQAVSYSLAPGGESTLDGFTIAALPQGGTAGRTAFFISETGGVWRVELDGRSAEDVQAGYAPARR
ncbi:MAG TPA: hypothetical protein ENN09_05390 [Planctomycetes bacterium]|nr:hypothetical protein [Planctomycetota bacterium]